MRVGDFEECYREPWCRGYHDSTIHDRLVEERAVYAASVPSGDPEEGRVLLWYRILPLLELCRSARGEPRCDRCGRIGPPCEASREVRTSEGETWMVLSYCGVD